MSETTKSWPDAYAEFVGHVQGVRDLYAEEKVTAEYGMERISQLLEEFELARERNLAEIRAKLQRTIQEDHARLMALPALGRAS